ncbi:MAG: NAD-dependent epimerase/dehydratase family protein [Acidimicrobiaceae bacterium]|jgi:UDP-glucose 4-epimerase
MRLLITGGGGSLGTNIIEHIGSQCESILVIDNFATGKKAALLPAENLQVVELSITEREKLDILFSDFQPTHVIHSAASYKDPNDWQEDSLTNVVGTCNVVRAAEKNNVKRLINFQTALCYGRPQQVPIPITHSTAPFTSYGITKTAGEAFVLNADMSSTSFRLANVTGPRLAIGPIPTFYKRLKAGEDCSVSTTVRDFLDMSDFLSLMELALADDAPTGVFNVSTGEGHTIEEIFRLVAQHVGKPNAEPVAINPPGPDDVAQVVLDPSETEVQYKWKAKVSFAETISRMLHWYDINGVTDIYSHLQEKK